MKHTNSRRFRSSLFIFHFSLIILLSACSDVMDPNFTVSSDFLRANNVALGGNEEKTTLHIEADCNWAIAEEADWLACSPVQGTGNQDVTLTTGVNPSAIDERSCQITITSDDGVRRIVTLRQSKATETLTASTAAISFGEEGGTNSFTITSNTTWAVTGGAEWLSYSPTEGTGNGSISIAVQTNSTEYSREAVLTVTGASGQKQTVTITQAEKAVALTIEPEIINATAIADDYTFQIHGNATWTVTVDDNTWLTLSATSGTGEATITVSPVDNTTSSPRTANIHVTSASGRIERTCTITQAAAAVPKVETVDISNLGRYIATFTSAFTSPLKVTAYGFVWGTSPEPTLENCTGHVSNADEALQFTETARSGKAQDLTSGSLTANVDGLRSGVKYYVRAYAINANGIGYSTDVTFETSGNIPGDDDNPTPNI